MTASPQPGDLTETFKFSSLTHTYTLHWTSLGSPSKPPVIFVHGTPWSSRVWLPFALALSNNFHIYLFDNPGFGASPLEQECAHVSFSPANEVERLDSDLARQSAAYVALFKSWEPSWGGRKPHVIAHDHGGLMALRAHLLHNCAYASLCLIDVVAIGPFGQPLFKAVAENPQYFLQLPDMAFEGILESYIRNAAFSELSKGVLEELKRPWLRERGNEGFVRQLCQANCRSTEAVEWLYERVGREMPVKVIWGSEDRWIGVETAERLARTLIAKDVVIIKEAGHLIMYDQPAQLGVEIGVWLATQ